MARILGFQIQNFKGADEVDIQLEGRSTSPVLTLIGLNESGKSTILEAISHFATGDKSIASLFEGQYAQASALSLIPLHKKAAFTGKISIAASVLLDEVDIREVEKLAKVQKCTVDAEALRKPFDVVRTFAFEDSALKKTSNYWNFPLHVKKGKAATFKSYQRPKEGSNEPDLWLRVLRYIEAHLEQVAYFPTFLVDMPERIYLREYDDETPINRHYRYVLQDILDSLGEGLELEKHVCKRIEEFQERENSPFWLSMLLGSPSKSPIDSVFQKLSNAITKEVLGSWQKVFQRAISAKSITVEWSVDAEKGGLPYASFYVSDGESRYAINERSLGFRWFFSFLLFTGFKQARQRKTIFIFDEPAANLHAKAQAELLTSFSRIASNGNKIIYSTHSHHMINPAWLGAAYIVENAALDYDKEDSFGLDTKPTKVSATPYRKFVADYPSRSSYFQPVIEKLEYVVPSVIGNGPYVIVEGISDYYALKIAEKSLKSKSNFSLVPGSGAGASGPIISHMLGQGATFVVLLDDDKEGKKAKAKYSDDWFLPESTLLTLGDISADMKNMSLERVLGHESITFIKTELSLAKDPTKKQIGWYLAEALASDKAQSLPDGTIKRLSKILQELERVINNRR
ncbi:AAA family ATPase [Thermomonas sp. LB-4]|uniref:AAA family ATPase n=1 Tax=Thermomonas sp. LB-4 TaxID=3102790 RepID=UPI002EDA8BEE